MELAITTTVIGVVGAALFSMYLRLSGHQRQDARQHHQDFVALIAAIGDNKAAIGDNKAAIGDIKLELHQEIHSLLEAHRQETNAKFDRLSDENKEILKQMNEGFRSHGERLARIEHELKIDPPADAA